MSRFTPQHYLALAMVIVGIGGPMAAAHDWYEVASPKFIGGALLSIGGAFVAMYSKKPEKPE